MANDVEYDASIFLAHLTLLGQVIVGMLTELNLLISKEVDLEKIPRCQIHIGAWPGIAFLLLLVVDPVEETSVTTILKMALLICSMVPLGKWLFLTKKYLYLSGYIICLLLLSITMLIYREAIWVYILGIFAHMGLDGLLGESIYRYIKEAKKQKRLQKNYKVLSIQTCYQLIMLIIAIYQQYLVLILLTLAGLIECIIIWLLDFMISMDQDLLSLKDSQPRNIEIGSISGPEIRSSPKEEKAEASEPETIEPEIVEPEGFNPENKEQEEIVEKARRPERSNQMESSPKEKSPVRDEEPIEEIKVSEPLPEISAEEKKKAQVNEEIKFELDEKEAKVSKNPMLAKIIIKRIIKSNQADVAKAFVKAAGTKSETKWSKAHFILSLDCSGSMKGKRWKNLTKALKGFLQTLSTMDDVVVSIFTFDDSPHLLCKEMDSKVVLEKIDKITFGGKGTVYGRAIDQIIYLITKAKAEHQDYLNCILFFSDGAGDPPTKELAKLVQIKKDGYKIMLFTIACETEEDEDLQKMAIVMNGDHYSTNSSEALKQIFSKILSLT